MEHLHVFVDSLPIGWHCKTNAPQHGDPAADARNSGGSADADAVDGAGSVVPNAYGDPVVRIVRTERLGGDVNRPVRGIFRVPCTVGIPNDINIELGGALVCEIHLISHVVDVVLQTPGVEHAVFEAELIRKEYNRRFLAPLGDLQFSRKVEKLHGAGVHCKLSADPIRIPLCGAHQPCLECGGFRRDGVPAVVGHCNGPCVPCGGFEFFSLVPYADRFALFHLAAIPHHFPGVILDDNLVSGLFSPDQIRVHLPRKNRLCRVNTKRVQKAVRLEIDNGHGLLHSLRNHSLRNHHCEDCKREQKC